VVSGVTVRPSVTTWGLVQFRCDYATYVNPLGTTAPQTGCVFPGALETFRRLSLTNDAEAPLSAAHVRQALYDPNSTYPPPAKNQLKTIPGLNGSGRPLHRNPDQANIDPEPGQGGHGVQVHRPEVRDGRQRV
jgi:hypothetical protein